MIFGLVSLLVIVGLMLMFFKTFEAPNIEVGQKAQQEAQQISGRDENGVPAMNSYKAEPFPATGNFRGIKITDVTPGGAMDKYYGLKVGDVVMKIGDMDAVAYGGDFGSAKAQLDEAYQHASNLVVQRDTAQISLPVGGAKSPLDGLIPTH
jgi:S1-C subfamily serine protease